jgi:ABC-type multidrug transport system fused ATPase/permease subunit
MNLIYRIFSKVLDTEEKTLEFILDSKSKIWQKLALILPISFWATAFSMFAPLFIKFQVDAITEKWTSLGSWNLETTFRVVVVILGGYFFLNVLNQCLWWLKGRLIEKVNFDSEAFLEDKFNMYLTKFDSSFLGAENNLRLVRNLQWGLTGLQENFLKIFQLAIEIPVQVIGLIVVLQFLHPYLMVAIAISTVVIMLIDAYKGQVWKQYELIETRAYEQKNQLGWRVVWYFNNFLTNGWLHNLYSMYTNKRTIWQKLKLRQTYATNNISLFINILNEISNIVTIILAAWLVLAGSITIGTLSIFASYGDRVKDLINKIGELFRVIVDMRFNLFRLSFLLNIKPKLDYSNILPFLESDIHEIEFKGVDFTYPGFFTEEKEYLHRMQKKIGILDDGSWWSKHVQSIVSSWTRKNLETELKELDEMFNKTSQNKQILTSLDFTLKKGNIYGIVGYNGAGKTTLTRLIKRTLDTQGGQIFFNQTPIKTIDPLLVKTYISSLEQNSYLIESLSVRDNILINAKNPVSDEKIWNLLEALDLKSSIDSLDDLVGEGVEFSGGQAQLLELVRVLISPSPIIILDEGTNQLDAIKEAKVMQLIKENTKNSIVLFITHRMTTCLKCDEVLVIENGKLAIEGKPKELLSSKKDNLFKTFWKVQVGETEKVG